MHDNNQAELKLACMSNPNIFSLSKNFMQKAVGHVGHIQIQD